MAFRLSELYVAITADEGPIKKTIAGLKTGMANAAEAVVKPFKQIGTVIAGTLAPLALLFAAYKILNEAIDKQSIYVQQLGRYWLVAMGFVRSLIMPIVRYIAEIVEAVAKWALQSKGLHSAWKTFLDWYDSAFATVKIAILRAVEVIGMFWRSGDQAFGGVASTIKGYVVPALEAVGRFFRNWPEYTMIAYLKVKEMVMNVSEQFKAMFYNGVQMAQWFAENWVGVMEDAFEAIKTMFVNWHMNIVEFGKALATFFMNPTRGFKFEWTPLLKGFESVVNEFPEMLKPQIANMGDQIKELQDKIHAREDAFAKRRKGADLEFSRQRVGAQSQVMGVAEARSRLIQNIFSGQGDIAKQQLMEAKRARENLEAMNKKMDNLGVAKAASP